MDQALKGHRKSKAAKLVAEGSADVATSHSSISQLGNLPASELVGAAKPNIANLLSARFPELRRMIAGDLNLRDRASLCLTSHSLNVSVNSQDHLEHFHLGFSGRCGAKLPLHDRHVYGISFKSAERTSCPEYRHSHTILRRCGGSKVLGKAQCSSPGVAICRYCVAEAYEIAHPGNFQNRVPNFGVTPICDSCAVVPESSNGAIDCHCTGPPAKDDEKREHDLWLCLECRVAYNVERFRAADDKARSYLYMSGDKLDSPEYLPGSGVDYMKMPACPCGKAMSRSRFNFHRTRGMCVWCGALKMPSTTNIWVLADVCKIFAHKLSTSSMIRLYHHVEEQTNPEKLTEHRVIGAESFAALQTQIEQKGPPLPELREPNRYWSYAEVTAEPRLLDPTLRQEYRQNRRTSPDCSKDKEQLSGNNHEEFLRHFRWPCMGEEGLHRYRMDSEAARPYLEMYPDALEALVNPHLRDLNVPFAAGGFNEKLLSTIHIFYESEQVEEKMRMSPF